MLLGVARRVRRLGDGAAIQMQILDVTFIAALAPTGKKLESRGAGRKHGVHALPAVHYRSFQVQPPFLGGLARVRVHGGEEEGGRKGLHFGGPGACPRQKLHFCRFLGLVGTWECCFRTQRNGIYLWVIFSA